MLSLLAAAPVRWLAGAAAALLLVAAVSWHASRVSQARAAGRAEVRAEWDRSRLEAERAAGMDALRRAERAMQASTEHEAERAALSRQLRSARHAVRTAAAAPIDCPQGPGATLGDLRVPGAVLDGLRRAAGAGASAD